MVYRISFFILLIIANIGFSASQSKNFVYFKLENGMEAYLYPDKKLPIISHVLIYKVGSASDPKGGSGLAHYLEHLMFRSSKNIQDISGEIHKLNAKYNAMTSDYFTIYYQTALKNKLENIMKIESERMQNLKINNISAETEKKVVIEERKMRVDNIPGAVLFEEMRAAFYRNSTAWNTIGWETEILNLSSQDAIEMYKKHYYPGNAILILAGDIEVEKAKVLIDKYYGITSKKNLVKQKYLAEPVHRSNIKLNIKNTISNERIVSYFYQAPNVSDENYIPTLVASYILGNDKSGKMYVELVHNLRLALDVFVEYNYLTKDPAIFNVSVLPMNQKLSLDILESGIKNVIDDILKNGITDEDLEAAKALAKADIIMYLDGITQKSIYSAIAIASGADFDHFNKLSSKISSVSLEQVNSALVNLLNSKKVVGFLE